VKKLLDPAYWARALSNPLVVAGLIVDLLPVYAIFAWGWNAVPLVMLYWMENVVAGVITLPRIVVSGARFGILGILGGLFLSAFFVVHYGLFCLVHGTFLVGFATLSNQQSIDDVPFADLEGLFRYGLQSGLHIDWIVYAIAAFHVIAFLVDFLWKGEWKRSSPDKEMASPYGRIVILHFGIFAGAGALFLIGQPMVGVLALVLFRAVWGIMSNSKRFGPEAEIDKATAASDPGEGFSRLLQGKNPNAS
jgi:hypothetical protein